MTAEQPKSYWLNRLYNVVHYSDCRSCFMDADGQVKRGANARRENWCGPYATRKVAVDSAGDAAGYVWDCSKCGSGREYYA